MWPRFLRLFANVFVVAYAVQAGLAVVHVGISIAVGRDFAPRAWSMLLVSADGFVLLLALMAIPLLGTTRRLAPSVFLPLVASTIWIAFGALPLPFLGTPLEIARFVVAGEVGLAFAAFVRIRDLRDGVGWLFPKEWFSEHRFSGRYLATYCVASAAATFVGLVVVGAATVAATIAWATNGFVRFDAHGIALSERTYELAVDPLANAADPSKRRHIRLVGMIHIGENEAYRSLFRDLDDATRFSIVLMEGISDADGLLEGQLPYRALADFLGVDEQGSIEGYVSSRARDTDGPPSGPMFVTADLDFNDFDPATVEWLREVGRVYSAEFGWAHLLNIYEELRRSPVKFDTVLYDVIDRRNQNLLAWIRASRINYREIIVPWGALHMPGIERAIIEMGFEPRTIAYVPLISWGTIASALIDQPEDPDEEASRHGPQPVSPPREGPGSSEGLHSRHSRSTEVDSISLPQRSNRSSLITLTQAATKSCTNLSAPSADA